MTAKTQTRWREVGIVALFFFGVAVLVSWPLVLRATTSLPSGLGDPALVTYLLAWDADRIAHAFRGFWDAPFLWPHHHTLAYSEHMLGVALFTAPLQWLTRNPVFVYNVAFFGSYVLAGVGVYLLVRDLFGRVDAALLAGLLFIVSPYRSGQTTHLHVLMSGWMPIALWALHRYFRTGSRNALAGFTIAFILQALCNGYFLFFFAIAVVVVVAIELAWPALPRVRMLRDVAISASAILVVLAPFAYTYVTVQREQHFNRPADEVLQFSARLTDYAKVVAGAWNWGGLLPPSAPERDLFLGAVALALALVGLATTSRSTRRVVVTYAAVATVAFLVSLGPGPWHLYSLFYRIVPGFSGMRVPARMATIVDLGVVVIAAAGAAWIFARAGKWTAIGLAVGLGAAAVVEGRPAYSIDVFPPVADRLDRAVYEWLRSAPPGPVVEVRIAEQRNLQPFTLFYQFGTLIHRHPIVNGYSAWPSILQEFLGGPASPFQEPGHVAETIRGLRSIGVRYLLLHRWTYKDPAEAAPVLGEIRAARDQTVGEWQFGETFAWRLADAPVAAPQPPAATWRPIDPRSFTATASRSAGRLALAFDGDVESRWLTGARQSGNDWIEIRLPRPTDVARVRIETSPRGLVDYPRHIVLESIDEHDVSRVLYDGPILTALIEGIVADERRAPVDLDLAPNRTAVLRIRQTGQTRLWYWSLHELRLWSRD